MPHDVAALKQRTRNFALAALSLAGRLSSNDVHRSIARQLIRSATAVGANYRSACRSRSRAEFIARIGLVLEEADESAFWMELLLESGELTDRTRWGDLLDEANQLTAIFAASSITASQNGER